MGEAIGLHPLAGNGFACGTWQSHFRKRNIQNLVGSVPESEEFLGIDALKFTQIKWSGCISGYRLGFSMTPSAATAWGTSLFVLFSLMLNETTG